MILFRNPGLIDLRAATTMGVNVKQDDSAIGFFGTGFKYAVALLLRVDAEIVIYRGLERHAFSAKEVTIRDKKFQIVCLDGTELGFTTELGKKWELWMAYRELYCNAMDEHGSVERFTEEFAPSVDETVIAVKLDEFDSVHDLRGQFLFLDKPQTTIPGLVEIVDRPSKHVFYRGVRVHTPVSPCARTYNILAKIDLTEDRTARYDFQVHQVIARSVLHDLSKGEIDSATRVICADSANYERSIDWSGYWIDKSPEFYDHVAKLESTGVCDLPDSVRKALDSHRQTSGEVLVRTAPLNSIQQQHYDSAVEFCKLLGFAIEDYPVLITERLGANTFGLAKNGKIYLAVASFDMGAKFVASTLIEEYIHLKHGFADCTRAMQTYLFDQIVSLGEEYVRKAPL